MTHSQYGHERHDNCADCVKEDRETLKSQLAEAKDDCIRLQQEINCLRMEPCQLPACVAKLAAAKAEIKHCTKEIEERGYAFQKKINEVLLENTALQARLDRALGELGSLCYSIAGTEGTKTNSELPEWFRLRLKDANEVLKSLSPAPQREANGKRRMKQADKYCPKHKFIDLKCLACVIRWATGLNERLVALSGNRRIEVLESAAVAVAMVARSYLRFPTSYARDLLKEKLVALDRELGERGGKA